MENLQARELRIGNFVKKGEEIFEADFITIQMANNYEPIPLSEEWLLKFGFSNIQYNKEIDCNIYSGWDFGSISIQYPRGIEAHIFLGNYPIAINYVHQLQNLYFALTNKELTIVY